ncbi:helix-turn-helix domain-containing protein [Rhizobium sp. Leaf341]|uniref:helix-turn-helix domain-containing protein n=1 Tax=Rhizobium sp. Leaf341 TaxID=1736344 RepID=UPI000AB9A821|nr:helix-turn-helix domain-containing protein [Rhizobium sp. Leaf341]
MKKPAEVLQLLTTKEVATLLAMSTKTLRDLVRNGEIAFIAIGNGTVRQRMAFHPRDIEDFVNRRRMRDAPVSGAKTQNVAAAHSGMGGDFMANVDRLIAETKRKR